MIELYEKYLNNIGESLDKFFEQQKPYICCKEGCSICCEYGEYPFTQLEFQYAMIGYDKLDEETKKIIQENVARIKELKEQHSEKTKFMHECPFLINKRCSIYKYRGLVCRNHGLMSYYTDENGELKYAMPHCVYDGLNYSKVFDEKLGNISSEKWKQSGIETEPVSYNVGLKFLLENNTTKSLGLDFGEAKALIDWFE